MRAILATQNLSVRFALTLCISALILTLSCSRDREEASLPQNQAAASPGFSLARAATPYRGETVRIIGEALPPLEALGKLKGEFESETGIKVAIEGLSYDLLTERATLDVSSGTGRYDIILQAPESWGRFAASGKLYPLQHFRSNPRLNDQSLQPEKQFFQKAWKDLGWYDGVAYGFPFSALTMTLWYRKDLLQDPSEAARFRQRYGYPLGVPQTWKQYHDIAEFFTRPQQGLYGTLVQGKRHPALWQEWLNLAYSFGGGTLRKENAWEYGDIIVNSPESVEATTFYKGLLSFSPPGTLEYTWDDALAAVQQGKVFMAIMWTDMCPAVEDPAASKVAGKIGYSKLPAGKSGSVAQVSGSAYLIPKTAKQPEAAYLFIQWLMKPENQVRLHLAGGQSGFKPVYSDPRVRKLPYAQGIFETLQVGVSMRETVPEAAAIGERVQIGLSDILRGKVAVQEGLDWIAVELSKVLGDKAKLAYPPLKAAA